MARIETVQESWRPGRFRGIGPPLALGGARPERASGGHLAHQPSAGHPGSVEEEQGIYRGEVTSIMFALADIYADTGRILALLGDEEDDGEEEEADA